MLERYRHVLIAPAAPAREDSDGATPSTQWKVAPAAPAAPEDSAPDDADAYAETILMRFAREHGIDWLAAYSEMVPGDIKAGVRQMTADNGDGAELASVRCWLCLLEARGTAQIKQRTRLISKHGQHSKRKTRGSASKSAALAAGATRARDACGNSDENATAKHCLDAENTPTHRTQECGAWGRPCRGKSHAALRVSRTPENAQSTRRKTAVRNPRATRCAWCDTTGAFRLRAVSDMQGCTRSWHA